MSCVMYNVSECAPTAKFTRQLQVDNIEVVVEYLLGSVFQDSSPSLSLTETVLQFQFTHRSLIMQKL